jgi:putative addiction module killer protein
MLPNALRVEQYVTGAGDCPFANWFDSLDTKAALKIRTAIARMESGNMGDIKPVGSGVSERRIDHGPGYRIYFGKDGKALVLLLVGGTKKRQQKDIDRAKTLWSDYRKRKRKAG